MDRKDISAFLIGCEPDQLMAFKDYGEDGAAAIGPDGKKYVFDAAYLDQAIGKIKAARKPAEPKAKPAEPAKRAARRTAKSAASKSR